MHAVIIYNIGDYGFDPRVKLYDSEEKALQAISSITDYYFGEIEKKSSLEFIGFRLVSEYLSEIKYNDNMEGECLLVIRYSQVEK